MNNVKRKKILNLWIIFISIILAILLFLLGLKLPKLFKTKKQPNQQPQHQYQYQYQYIYDTNKVNDILRLLELLKELQRLKELQNQVEKQKETQPIINLVPQKDFFPSQVPFKQLNDLNYLNDDKKSLMGELASLAPKLGKELAVVGITVATGAAICVVAAPILASLGPAASLLALL
ncbi:hypothetical protein HPP_4980 [Hydrangea phyllody phytoplasma]|uniref:Uncharacterized protein n=2 Tax=16SrI (Aster yellows group) TaxID=3042590 RepID=A0ABQ5PU13_9MOLU|nr:hypothetical protein [Hydrangea phyllody phytoplasma]GFZ75540.1 hypothetical protein HPP_4980 [Hydrangea phyllody phytoplasma]GLH61566.1 hypothetical protein RHYP_5120 [Rhus yellows phytoplasma]GLH61772.1 hypothetical protein HP2P_1790 [Hydrangea phyllody phytoplasma]